VAYVYLNRSTPCIFSQKLSHLSRPTIDARCLQVGGPSKVQRIHLYLRVFSSCLSIGVGVLWLTLTAMGILDQVLP
jgi:hypothetical protein